MKLVIPKQHGAWAMLVIPFLLSVILGKPTMYHIPLFFSLVLYLFSYVSISYVHKTKRKKSIYMLQLYILLLRSYLG
ncbi:YwiC-like family protein [Bacillus cereus]